MPKVNNIQLKVLLFLLVVFCVISCTYIYLTWDFRESKSEINPSISKCPSEPDTSQGLCDTIAPYGKLKIYLYNSTDIGKTLPTHEYCFHKLSRHYFNSVHQIALWMKENGYLTTNATEADFFLVTTFHKCVRNRKYDDILDIVMKTPNWKRNNGKDHLVLTPSGAGGSVLRCHKNHKGCLENPIILSPEAYFMYVTEAMYVPHFHLEKDILIPGYVPPRESPIPFIPMKNRTLLANYAGAISRKSFQRKQMGKLKAMLNKEIKIKIIAQQSSHDYHKDLLNSKLNFVPQGHSPWTVRLYEAMYYEAIPVIFDNRFRFPSTDTIPWESIIIRWPENFIAHKAFIKFLTSLSDEKLQKRQDTLRKYKNQILYQMGKPPVSDYMLYSLDVNERMAYYTQNANTKLIHALAKKKCTLNDELLLGKITNTS